MYYICPESHETVVSMILPGIKYFASPLNFDVASISFDTRVCVRKGDESHRPTPAQRKHFCGKSRAMAAASHTGKLETRTWVLEAETELRFDVSTEHTLTVVVSSVLLRVPRENTRFGSQASRYFFEAGLTICLECFYLVSLALPSVPIGLAQTCFSIPQFIVAKLLKTAAAISY